MSPIKIRVAYSYRWLVVFIIHAENDALKVHYENASVVTGATELSFSVKDTQRLLQDPNNLP